MVNRLGWARTATLAARAYLILLVGLFGVRLVLGDRAWALFAAGSLLLYAFLPAPLVLAIGVWQRSRALVAGFGILLLMWCWLWGGLFLPREQGIRISESGS